MKGLWILYFPSKTLVPLEHMDLAGYEGFELTYTQPLHLNPH